MILKVKIMYSDNLELFDKRYAKQACLNFDMARKGIK